MDRTYRIEPWACFFPHQPRDQWRLRCIGPDKHGIVQNGKPSSTYWDRENAERHGRCWVETGVWPSHQRHADQPDTMVAGQPATAWSGAAA